MKVTKKMLSVVAATLLSFGGTMLAEEHDTKKGGKEQTLTGCLSKGADVAQHYTFMDQKSGKKWTVTGSADLEKHSANHTVKLTGSPTAKVFNVTKVEHVSATCDAKGGSSGAAAKP
jgi:hypothetical protein